MIDFFKQWAEYIRESDRPKIISFFRFPPRYFAAHLFLAMLKNASDKIEHEKKYKKVVKEHWWGGKSTEWHERETPKEN